MTDLISYGYAITVLTGGIIGYVKANSIPSLVAGLFFSGFAAWGARNSSLRQKDVIVGLGTSAALFGFMAYRFYNSQKFMPAGFISILSLLQTFRLIYRGSSD